MKRKRPPTTVPFFGGVADGEAYEIPDDGRTRALVPISSEFSWVGVMSEAPGPSPLGMKLGIKTECYSINRVQWGAVGELSSIRIATPHDSPHLIHRSVMALNLTLAMRYVWLAGFGARA